MQLKKIDESTSKNLPYTALLYCKPGVGKSTAIGLIAEQSEGNTLVLDVDRTIMRTLAKNEVVKDTSKLFVEQIDNIHTFTAWANTLKEITPEWLKQNNITTVAVMQFKLVNSLRYMKSWGVNIIWTAWETADNFTHPDGTQYTKLQPKISLKIVDNICGLCDVVGWIAVNKDNEHHILLEATQNIYAKNQIDNRKSCKVDEFIGG